MLDDLAARFDQFSAKALDFITRILRPDGKLPPIGDTEQQSTADAYRETFRYTLAYQHFCYAHSQGERGLVPPALNRVYPSSGYALFRDHFTDDSEGARTPFVTMALKVLSPVVHHRRVALDADAKVVEIADEITSEDGQSRNITLQWHIPLDKTIVLEDHRVELSSPKGNRLRITFEGATADQCSVATGQKQDRVFSCISYQAN